MAKRRRVGNLLALAVLSATAFRPMHPYEIGQALRGWGKDRDMQVKWGSLYTVVNNLVKHGLLEAAEVARQGARPERTVYRITDDGRAELADWARELVSTPEPEPRRFKAGLSVLSAIEPDEAISLLQQRVERLERELTEQRAELAEYAVDVPALMLIEDDYELAMLAAEVAWVRSVLDQLTSGDYPGLADWRAWHATGATPDGLAELAERSLATD